MILGRKSIIAFTCDVREGQIQYEVLYLKSLSGELWSMVELLSGRRKFDSGQLYSLKMPIAVSAVWGVIKGLKLPTSIDYLYYRSRSNHSDMWQKEIIIK